MGIIEEMVIEYADVDENKRLDMFLEYPDLRGPFQKIDQSNLNTEMGTKTLVENAKTRKHSPTGYSLAKRLCHGFFRRLPNFTHKCCSTSAS